MQLRNRIAIVVLAAALVVPVSATAKKRNGAKAAAKMKDVHKLLRLTGANRMGAQMVEALFMQFRQQYPDVPAKHFAAIRKRSKGAKGLVNEVARVYAKHLSHEDIKGLVAFHATPLGKRFIAAQPTIMQASLVAGRQFAARMSQEVMAELKRRKLVK